MSWEQKKSIVIQILIKMKPYRDIADGLLILIESQYVTDEIIDTLISLIYKSMSSIEDITSTQKMQQAITVLNTIKEQEQQSQQQDIQEAENLLSQI
jgi:hypothetical protein